MEISVKQFKSLIQEEFNRFHSLLDRRQDALTAKIDEYLGSQHQEKDLNPVKVDNTPEPSSIDSTPLSQLSVLQFIAEDKPKLVDKKPKIFEIKFQLFKEPVEKEIEQCGEIRIEQIVDSPPPVSSQRPQVIDFSDVPSPVHDPCTTFIKKEKEIAPLPFAIKQEFCDCDHEKVAPVPTTPQPKFNAWSESRSENVAKQSPSKEDGPEYDVIMNEINSELHKGDIWCLVNCDWFKRWRLYSNADKTSITKSMHPGPINNSGLLNSSGLLRNKLVHNIDYKLVPINAWKRLESVYGVKGPTVRRWVVEYGKFIQRLRVEIYPLALKCLIQKEETVFEKIIYMSRVANFQNLETQIRVSLKLPSESLLRISYKSHTNRWIQLEDVTLTPQTLDFYEGQEIGIKITKESEKRLKKTRKGSVLETNKEKKRKKCQ